MWLKGKTAVPQKIEKVQIDYFDTEILNFES